MTMRFVNVISTGPNAGDVQALRDDAELRRKQEIHEAEESKNAHIQDLMKKHEKVCSDTQICILLGKTLTQTRLLASQLS